MKIPIVQSSPHRKKTKSSPSSTHYLPTHLLNYKNNVRGLYGETFIRDYQYPSTIRTLLRKIFEEKLKLFIESLDSNPHDLVRALEVSDGTDYSESGCLRWVYDTVHFNDIQERYEASDDVSFDVRGNFCYSCELSRKMVELKPIIFETPEEGQTDIQLDKTGYTDKLWEWINEPLRTNGKHHIINHTGNKFIVYEVSPDVFRYVLNMIISKAELKQFRESIFGYRCGNNRVSLIETISKSTHPTDLDFQNDIARHLRDLESVKELLPKCMYSINISEINPFVTDDDNSSNDQCYYTDGIKINQNSNIIHYMNINIHLASGYTITLVCPETPMLIDYNIVMNMSEFPDIDVYYPYMFYAKKNLGDIILYSLMYLMEQNSEGEFSNVVNNQPDAFYMICKNYFSREDSEILRKRLIVYKRNSRDIGYLKAIKSIRNSLISLKTTQQTT